jgi:hypothetical protein
MFPRVPLPLSFLVSASLPCNSDSFPLHPPICVAFTSSWRNTNGIAEWYQHRHALAHMLCSELKDNERAWRSKSYS